MNPNADNTFDTGVVAMVTDGSWNELIRLNVTNFLGPINIDITTAVGALTAVQVVTTNVAAGHESQQAVRSSSLTNWSTGGNNSKVLYSDPVDPIAALGGNSIVVSLDGEAEVVVKAQSTNAGATVRVQGRVNGLYRK